MGTETSAGGHIDRVDEDPLPSNLTVPRLSILFSYPSPYSFFPIHHFAIPLSLNLISGHYISHQCYYPSRQHDVHCSCVQ